MKEKEQEDGEREEKKQRQPSGRRSISERAFIVSYELQGSLLKCADSKAPFYPDHNGKRDVQTYEF